MVSADEYDSLEDILEILGDKELTTRMRFFRGTSRFLNVAIAANPPDIRAGVCHAPAAAPERGRYWTRSRCAARVSAWW